MKIGIIEVMKSEVALLKDEMEIKPQVKKASMEFLQNGLSIIMWL